MSSFIRTLGISLTSLQEDLRVVQHARRNLSGKVALGKDTTFEQAEVAEQEQWLRYRVRQHEDEIRMYTKENREILSGEDHVFLRDTKDRLRKIEQRAQSA